MQGLGRDRNINFAGKTFDKFHQKLQENGLNIGAAFGRI